MSSRHFTEARHPGLASAYLFGSHAEHRAHRESDVDVAVLLSWEIPTRDLRSFPRIPGLDVVEW